MNYQEINLLHTNDMHSYMSNFAQKADIINRRRRDNQSKGISTYYFDSGDLFSGSIYFNLFRGVKEIELMNLIKCDAMTLGNHEFDHGDELLSRLEDFAHFPIVSSNIHYHNSIKSAELVPIEDYLTFNLSNNLRFFVIGVTTLDTVEVASPSNNIIFEDPYAAITRTISKIKSIQENPFIILLSHLGFDEDLKLSDHLSDINIILGGHTHTILNEPVIKNKTLILQAGQYGKWIGDLKFRLYDDGSYDQLSYQLLEVDGHQEEDVEVKAVIDEMRAERDRIYLKPIATVPSTIDGERTTIRQENSPLGSLITEAFYLEAHHKGHYVQASLINGGGVRTSLKEGEVYYSDIVEILPFSKRILVIKISGKNLRIGLDEGLHPQYYGLKMVDNQWFIKVDNEWSLIEDALNYTIVTNSFVWSGKDNYDAIHEGALVEDIGLDVDIFTSYLAERYDA